MLRPRYLEEAEFEPSPPRGHRAPRTAPPHTASPVSLGSLYENPIGERLLQISTENQCRDMLVSCRPPQERRFSGDNRNIDFESHLNQFALVTDREGVTDLMKMLELRFWFSGSALTVCNLYENEPDSSVALRKVKAHLRRDYGRRNYSAQQMLAFWREN